MDALEQIRQMQEQLANLERAMTGGAEARPTAPTRPVVPAFEVDLDFRLERQGANVILRNSSGMELASFPAAGFKDETGIYIPDGGSTEVEIEATGGDSHGVGFGA